MERCVRSRPLITVILNTVPEVTVCTYIDIIQKDHASTVPEVTVCTYIDIIQKDHASTVSN